MLRGGMNTFPFPQVKPLQKLRFGTDLYAFAVYDTDAPVDEPTTGSRWLGVEPDVYLHWQLTSDIALTARYGLFIPGDGVVQDGRLRQFLFTGMTIAF
jgi:hypothetical protein